LLAVLMHDLAQRLFQVLLPTCRRRWLGSVHPVPSRPRSSLPSQPPTLSERLEMRCLDSPMAPGPGRSTRRRTTAYRWWRKFRRRRGGRLGDRDGGHWRGAERSIGIRRESGTGKGGRSSVAAPQRSDGCTVVSVCSDGPRVLQGSKSIKSLILVKQTYLESMKNLIVESYRISQHYPHHLQSRAGQSGAVRTRSA
jgi:hypothetical protein